MSRSIIAGTTYYVTVTTLAGTSSTSSFTVYTYSLLVPLVSPAAPVSGLIIKTGTQVAVTGTGFYTGATVYFTSGMTCGGSSNGVSATVNSNSSITAVAPTLAAGNTYCVSVSVGGFTSTNSLTFTAY